LKKIETLSCLLEIEGDGDNRDLTIDFAKFSMLLRKGEFELVAKAQGSDGNKMGTEIRKSVRWQLAILRVAGYLVDEDYDNDKFQFCFDPQGSSFNVTPQMTTEQIDSIWSELRDLYQRRIANIDYLGTLTGSEFCSVIIDQCGYPVQLMVDVEMGTFHYSGDYGELILNNGGLLEEGEQVEEKEQNLDIKYVEFASDPLTDFNCLSNDYRIN
jgi:hypothetical protein